MSTFHVIFCKKQVHSEIKVDKSQGRLWKQVIQVRFVKKVRVFKKWRVKIFWPDSFWKVTGQNILTWQFYIVVVVHNFELAPLLHIQDAGTIHLVTRISSRSGGFKALSAWKNIFLNDKSSSATTTTITKSFLRTLLQYLLAFKNYIVRLNWNGL